MYSMYINNKFNILDREFNFTEHQKIMRFKAINSAMQLAYFSLTPKQISNQSLTSGIHQVSYDGENANANSLVAGVEFQQKKRNQATGESLCYRTKTQCHLASRKMKT